VAFDHDLQRRVHRRRARARVGQGVLRECLLDPGVERVVCVGRATLGQTHEKLSEIVRTDVIDSALIASELRGYCLGVLVGRHLAHRGP
jgi:hypothetical protein